MAKEEDDKGSETESVEGDGSGICPEDEPDPENGRVGGRLLLKRAAETALSTYIKDVIASIVTNIKAKHLPSTKMLLDMADHLESRDATPAEFDSFAKVLLKEYLEEVEKLKVLETTEKQE